MPVQITHFFAIMRDFYEIEQAKVSERLEDWLWLKLRQGDVSHTGRQIAVEYGIHYGEARTPLVYWTALFLSGQFEAAVNFMFRQNKDLSCHAVHIALILYQIGWLLMPETFHPELCKLNFSRIQLIFGDVNCVEILCFKVDVDMSASRSLIVNLIFLSSFFKSDVCKNFLFYAS
ncbi:unnamed protein product [Soboliphyme baturini]|uniref:Nuclear pore protein n=1 Tax=Soboliphyme baturini TaxID=241478 RepID=A0A183JAR3_9BILA|nr:unnamed protein product [Soboliphyme baturini]